MSRWPSRPIRSLRYIVTCTRIRHLHWTETRRINNKNNNKNLRRLWLWNAGFELAQCIWCWTIFEPASSAIPPSEKVVVGPPADNKANSLGSDCSCCAGQYSTGLAPLLTGLVSPAEEGRGFWCGAKWGGVSSVILEDSRIIKSSAYSWCPILSKH